MNTKQAEVLVNLINSNGSHVCLVGKAKEAVTIDRYLRPRTADDIHLFYDNVGYTYAQGVLDLNIKEA